MVKLAAQKLLTTTLFYGIVEHTSTRVFFLCKKEMNINLIAHLLKGKNEGPFPFFEGGKTIPYFTGGADINEI